MLWWKNIFKIDVDQNRILNRHYKPIWKNVNGVDQYGWTKNCLFNILLSKGVFGLEFSLEKVSFSPWILWNLNFVWEEIWTFRGKKGFF